MRITCTDIENAVCAVFGLSRWDLHARTSRFAISHPRACAFYLMREHTTLSYPQIAAKFGFDHTSVLYARNNLPKLLRKYPELERKFDAVRELLVQTAYLRSKAEVPFAVALSMFDLVPANDTPPLDHFQREPVLQGLGV